MKKKLGEALLTQMDEKLDDILERIPKKGVLGGTQIDKLLTF